MIAVSFEEIDEERQRVWQAEREERLERIRRQARLKAETERAEAEKEREQVQARRRPGRPRLEERDPALLSVVCHKHDAGVSIRRIAVLVGHSEEAVRRMLRRSGRDTHRMGRGNATWNRKGKALTWQEMQALGIPLACDVYHGVRSTYSRWGCRCIACCEANTAYMAEWKKRGGKDECNHES